MLGALCDTLHVVLPLVSAMVQQDRHMDDVVDLSLDPAMVQQGQHSIHAVIDLTNRSVTPNVVVEPDVIQLNDETSMMNSCFDVTELDYFQSKTGAFSRSNYCNVENDSPFPLVSSSPRIAFAAQSCAGHHMWIDPPHDKIENYMQHYVKGKKENPASTSAVIIIPRWQGGPHWRRHLKESTLSRNIRQTHH